jgi:hypothetical protein
MNPPGLSDPTATVSTRDNNRTRLTDHVMRRDCKNNGVTPGTGRTYVPSEEGTP